MSRESLGRREVRDQCMIKSIVSEVHRCIDKVLWDE